MKVVQINSVYRGSTGRIMIDISDFSFQNGIESYCFYGRGRIRERKGFEKFGDIFTFLFHGFLGTFFDLQGLGSLLSTRKMIKRLKQIEPDIIHLHNVHGYYLNYPKLFAYIKNDFKGKVVWTLHDCWAFTGHCPYFTIVDCNKWEKECCRCENRLLYPSSFFLDLSKYQYHKKKKYFSTLNHLQFVVPSNWLNDLVARSFLKNHPSTVINNWIDHETFHPNYDQELFAKYGIPQKKIILGVANIWEKRKGLDVFVELSSRLSDDYVIVLVGLSRRQLEKIPNKIIGISRTNDAKELAKLYSEAHLFVNPSKEETFSLVTLEALACGTRVVVPNTSAAKELVVGSNGVILTNYTIEDYLDAIEKMTATDYDVNDLVEFSKNYTKEKKVGQYITLYKDIVS